MKLKQIIKIMILILSLFLLMCIPVNASQTNYGQENQGLKIADIDISKEDLSGIYGAQGNTYNVVGGKIIGVAQYICYAAAVIVLLYKGVQFMVSAPEAKAELKKQLVSYVVGGVILFAIGSLIKIIGSIALNNLF